MAKRSILLSLSLLLPLALGCGNKRNANATQPTAGATAVEPNLDAVDKTVDELVAAHWEAAGVRPASRVDDATFLRRATLDLTGRIPTPDEVSAFLADSSPQKRRKAVDALLQRPQSSEHWADVHFDLFLGTIDSAKKRFRQTLHTWLVEQFERDAPYDAIARELLTAKGPSTESSPHAFLVEHHRLGSVEAVTGQTARAFLGISLQCVQCHDHPTDPRYEQEDFYAFAAYFGKTRFRNDRKDSPAALIDRPRGAVRMPTENDEPGMRSGKVVAPKFFGRTLEVKPGQTQRDALAEAIIGSDLFAKTVVNRTWSQLFGRGLVEPWDDLGGEGDPRHPPLLTHLAREFAAAGYSHDALLRTIVLSNAYQRASWDEDLEGTAAREQAFAQAAVRPMNPRQLVRSLMLASDTGADDRRTFRRQMGRGIQKVVKETQFVFADDEMASADAFSGNVPQALSLLNGELTNYGSTPRRGSLVRQIMAQHDDPRARVDALYLTIFGRPPTPAQQADRVKRLAQQDHSPQAYSDLMHAMLMSSEFVTIH